MKLGLRRSFAAGGLALALALSAQAAIASPGANTEWPASGTHSNESTAEASPAGYVPGGNNYKTKASCQARGRYLMNNPPPNMHYRGFICIKNSYNDRWSLLMDSPEVGCRIAPLLATRAVGTERDPIPADC